MDIIAEKENTELKEQITKSEVLKELEPKIEEFIEKHKNNQKLWFSNDFLPADEKNDEDIERSILKLRDRARGIHDSVRVGIALNLLTEEGLPHFHRLIALYLDDNSTLKRWNYLWTAEEDRHGCVLRDYVRESRLFNYRELEKLQFDYMNAGFDPLWNRDPYKVFVYTSLQEKATQVSHRNLGNSVGEDEPLIMNILNSIAVDEAKHYNFYRNVFKAILEIDPNRGLLSAAAIMPSIDMPGIGMPNFKDMAEVAYKTDIYGPWDYKEIVESLIEFWDIENITGLNQEGEKARDKILQIPKRLKKVAEFIDHRRLRKEFSFNFLYNRNFSL